MAQQTAVIWLQQAMKSTLSHEQIMAVEGLYQQALAMEKDQIVDAWHSSHVSTMTGEQYYNETYESNT